MPLIELTARRSNQSVTPDKIDVQADMIIRLETIGQTPSSGGPFTRVWFTSGDPPFVDVEEDRATIRELVG